MDQTQNTPQSPTQPNLLDEKIKSKFKLFQGLRSEEEDQKFYDKVLDLTFDEMMNYLAENLEDAEKQNMLNEMAKEESDEGKNKVITNYFSKVENFQAEFMTRMDNFLNTLMYNSLNSTNTA